MRLCRMQGYSERSAATIRKPALALATTTPCCWSPHWEGGGEASDIPDILDLWSLGNIRVGAAFESERDCGLPIGG